MSLCVLCGLHSVICGLPNRTHVSLTHRAHRLELWTVNAHVAVWRSGDWRETAITLCKTESETHGDSHRSHCCDLRVAPGVKSSLYINNRQPYGSLSNVLRNPRKTPEACACHLVLD